MRVVFTPSGLSTDVDEPTPVLDIARELGVDLDTVCGGRSICGRCQVIPSFGQHPKWGVTVTEDALSAPNRAELGYSGRRPLGDDHRLGCQAKVCGDVVLDVPPASRTRRQIVRKQLLAEQLADLWIDGAVELDYIVLDDDALARRDRGVSATQLIANALDEQWDVGWVTFEAPALSQVHRGIEAGAMTVALRRGDAVAAVWPGLMTKVFGISIDIGSTTLAGHLSNLMTGETLASHGVMNPQIRYGDDLMSRVSYVMLNEDGAAHLTTAVRIAVDELCRELIAEAGVGTDQVLEVVAVANPVMHHLFLGVDPTPLGGSPFNLSTDRSVELLAPMIGIDLPSAQVYLPPCVAGHVGADTTAAIAAERPHERPGVQLLIDIGTNAEIVLSRDGELFAASSPTGPAFEGAQTSAGVRATAGAIERVRIDPVSLEPRFTVIGSPHWNDDPGFGTEAGFPGVIGICGSGIIEALAEMSKTGVLAADGTIRGDRCSERIVADGRTFSYRLTDSIAITQTDVRAIQLAKAALRAGIALLMNHAGVDQVDEIRLAGAFGAHIDPQAAVDIDLLPAAPIMSAPGNSAGAGAARLLLSLTERTRLERLVLSITKIETAVEPRFQELFVAAMRFPLACDAATDPQGDPDVPHRPSTHRRRRRRSPRSA